MTGADDCPIHAAAQVTKVPMPGDSGVIEVMGSASFNIIHERRSAMVKPPGAREASRNPSRAGLSLIGETCGLLP